MLLNSYLEIGIGCLSPFIIAAALAFAWYIWKQQVAKGKNGIYRAIVYTSLLFAATWTVTALFYVVDGLNYYNGDNLIGTGFRVARLSLAVATLLNMTQWYRALSKEE